jgi:hypothetical protein
MTSLRADPPREAAAPTIDRGGVLLAYQDDDGRPALVFIPASVASRLTALTCVIDVPGAKPPARGLALADGEVVTVLEIGKPASGAAATSSPHPDLEHAVPGSDRAVLCVIGTVRVALTGGTVVATGTFDTLADGAGVLWRGEPVPTLDVRALYARAETAIWAERAVSSRPSAPPSGRDAAISQIPPAPRNSVPPRPGGNHGDPS